LFFEFVSNLEFYLIMGEWEAMIAVTGATGHIGNVLVRELIARGNKVRAVVPPGEDTCSIQGLGVETVSGDVRDVESLKRAFTGIEIVFHLAGIISILPGKQKLLETINVQGTQNVVEACLQTGARRLVYTSSIHALKEPPQGIVITESQPFEPDAVPAGYARTKARASLAVLQAVKKGLDAVIVCPTGVIGPYDYKISEMGTLVRNYLSRKLKVCIDGAYDFVDVRDVATGMILAGDKGRTGERYILSGEQITVSQLLSTLERITGIRAPKLKVPCWLAKGVGILATPYYLLSRSKPLFTAYSIDVLLSNSLVSSAKARHELGYSPRSIRESIFDTVVWLKEETKRRCEAGKVSSSFTPA
jgi:dihydroflavonol-4-reductase